MPFYYFYLRSNSNKCIIKDEIGLECLIGNDDLNTSDIMKS